MPFVPSLRNQVLPPFPLPFPNASIWCNRSPLLILLLSYQPSNKQIGLHQMSSLHPQFLPKTAWSYLVCCLEKSIQIHIQFWVCAPVISEILPLQVLNSWEFISMTVVFNLCSLRWRESQYVTYISSRPVTIVFRFCDILSWKMHHHLIEITIAGLFIRLLAVLWWSIDFEQEKYSGAMYYRLFYC